MDSSTHLALLSFSVSQSLLKLVSIELVMPSNHLILCRPLLLLPSIFPSIRVFSSESALHIRWPKYWSFSFSISPSIKYLGLISFRQVWSPCSPRNSLESSPAQFESISSLALGLLYGPTLTSIHDYWKNHSFGYRGCEVKWNLVMSDSLWPCGLYSPWNSLGQNTGVDSLSLLQEIFLMQESTRVSYVAGGFFTNELSAKPYRECGERAN